MSTRIEESVKEAALDAGFDLAGIAAVRDFPELARFPEWISSGRAGEMKYLESRDDKGRLKRASLPSIFPWARSVIVCAVNYNTTQPYSTGQGRSAWPRFDTCRSSPQTTLTFFERAAGTRAPVPPQPARTQIVARWTPGPRTCCRRVCHNEHGLPERITTGRQQLSRLMHLCRCSRPGGKITPAYNTLPAYNEGLLCAPPRK